MGIKVAIMGATGAVGTELLDILAERKFPISELRLLASARSAGKTLQFQDEDIKVKELTHDSFKGIDLVLASAGGKISKEFAPSAVKAGAVVVDNTSHFRMAEGVPLVIPEINPEDIFTHKGIIANPNCSTIIMALPLWPLRSVIVPGETESSLGAVARAAAARHKLQFLADPLPERNAFVRSDQYSFVKAKVPALAFKFGFEKGTPQFETERAWRSTRYHALSDNLDQPGVFKADAVKLDDYVASIARAVANAPKRPQWLATSAFNPAARATAGR